MKHQVFFFLSIFSFSVHGMYHDKNQMPRNKNQITKTQLIDGLTDFNYHMKQYHADTFDAKKFGLFILTLRGVNASFFEDHKKDMFDLMKFVPNSINTREVS